MYGIIYKITNIENNKIYIGQTKRPMDVRFKQHLKNAFKEDVRLKHLPLINAIRKYGTKSFIIEKIDEAETKADLNQKERYWIKHLNSLDKNIGYNVSEGGEGGVPYASLLQGAEKRKGRKHSSLWKENISKAHKGKKLTDEHKKHLSENHRLKTTHVLLYKDGHLEVTKDSFNQLALRLNTTASRLVASSRVGEFRCGDFYILDVEDFSMSFDHKYRYNKEKCFYDPIRKDIVSHNTLRLRNQHNLQKYKDVNLYNYTEEKLKEKQEYILRKKDLLNSVLNKEE